MRGRVRRVWTAVAALVLTAACGGGGRPAEPAITLPAPVTTIAPTTTTTTAVPASTTTVTVPSTTRPATTSTTATTRSTTTTRPGTTTTTGPTSTTTRPATTTTTRLPTTTPPSTAPPSTAPATVVWRGSSAGKRIALTFDAGSDDANAAAIVATLRANGAPGTFFVTGRFAERYPTSLRAMAALGSVYNHSYSHPSFTGVSNPDHLTPAQMLDQIQRGDAAIAAVTGRTTKPYFRPPYGDQNATVNAVLGQAGYRYDVLWTIDSKGWKGVAPEQVVQNVLTQAVPGAIVAMHVGTGATDAAALQRVIDGLRAQGYTLVPLSTIV